MGANDSLFVTTPGQYTKCYDSLYLISIITHLPVYSTNHFLKLFLKAFLEREKEKVTSLPNLGEQLTHLEVSESSPSIFSDKITLIIVI